MSALQKLVSDRVTAAKAELVTTKDLCARQERSLATHRAEIARLDAEIAECEAFLVSENYVVRRD